MKLPLNTENLSISLEIKDKFYQNVQVVIRHLSKIKKKIDKKVNFNELFQENHIKFIEFRLNSFIFFISFIYHSINHS